MNQDSGSNGGGRPSDRPSDNRGPRPRGGSRPMRGGRPRGGGGGGGGGRGGPRGGGGPGDIKSRRPPLLLGEPSPGLAKINAMNMAQLNEKIASLDQELDRVTAKLGRLESQDVKPEEKIKTVKVLIDRLKALKIIAEKRLNEKAQRKADYDARQGNG